ncbi:MAG: DUF6149 family protein [Halobacteriaceae archaeon]
MRLYQTWKDYLTQIILTHNIPLLSRLIRWYIINLHVKYFIEHSEQHATARKQFLDTLFDTALDVYVRASHEGYPEAQAREITHIQATWLFIQKGWGELIEYPPEETEQYYTRYQEFYDRYNCSPTDPFGDFTPPNGFPSAPDTPDRMNGSYPLAEPGLTDDIYVLTDDLTKRLENGNAPKGALNAKK